MIITRSPLRISLGGGGTDLPSYYQEHSGFLIAAAIDKYVYITLHRTFVDELIVKYSKLERVKRVAEIEHPLIREALQLVGVNAPYLEITSMADIPAGTGLGSSGSFTTALLKALHAWRMNLVHPSANRINTLLPTAVSPVLNSCRTDEWMLGRSRFLRKHCITWRTTCSSSSLVTRALPLRF